MRVPRPVQVARFLRRASLLLAGLGLAWILWRFDTLRVPGEGSPVLRFAPGDRLVVDRRFEVLEVTDVVLVVDEGGLQHLVRVLAFEDGAERARRGVPVRVRCDGDQPSSTRLAQPTWLPGDAVRGRVLLAWPW